MAFVLTFTQTSPPPEGSDELLAELLHQTGEVLDRLRVGVDDDRGVSIDDVPDSVVVARRDGTFLLNTAAISLIGDSATATDPWSIDVRQRSGMVLAEEERPLVRALRKGETVLSCELAVVGAGGGLIPVLVTAFPRHGRGGQDGAVEIMRRAPADGAERRDLQERAAVVAHELRGAATSLGFVRTQLERNAPVPPERLTRAIDRVTRLARVLLDEEGVAEARERQLVDLARMVSEETGSERSVDWSRLIETTFGDGIPVVEGDPVALRQVLTNLLDNAIKYGNPTAPIAVSVREVVGAVVVEVRSRGARVAPDEVPFVFHRYFRAARRVAGDTDAARASQGLGLDVCKRIVEAHGGSITFESEDGVTTVTFAIPAVAGPDLHRASGAPAVVIG